MRWLARWALGFRAEGLGLAEALPHAGRYLAKQALGQRAAEPGVEAWLRAGPPAPRPPGPPLARLGLLGDLMWTRGLPVRPDPAVRAAFAACDALIGNLETPLDPAARVPHRLPDHRRYNSRAADLLGAFDGRLRAASLANNHALDQGPAGLRRTAEALAAAGVLPVGTRDRPTARLPVAGLELGLAAAGWGLNAPDPDPPVVVLPGLARARRAADVDLGPARAAAAALATADLRVLLLHWGHEFEAFPTAAQTELAEALADMGWDLIAGSHPHEPQPLRALPRPGRPPAWVAFSLGNAVSAMPGRRAGTGWLLPVDLWRSPAGVAALPAPPVAWRNRRAGGAHVLDGGLEVGRHGWGV
jgi:poly-gamma-glutamate synthesis protein (capsule biosynthesis protein)